jgi:hypothetical protein
MATQLQIKRTSITARTPNTTSSGNSTYIAAGELAINLTDGKLFSSNGTSLIVVGSNVATLNVTSSANLPNTVTISGTSGTNGQFVAIVGSNLAFDSPLINHMSDVDTVTTSPANNNLLMWSNGVSKWVPSSNISVNTLSGGIISRVVTIADGVSITMNGDTTDIATQTNTQIAGTLTINAVTGTLTNGQKIVLRLQSTNVQTFAWNAIFTGSTDCPLPTVSSGSSKYDYVGFIYNTTATKWQLLAKNFGFT